MRNLLGPGALAWALVLTLVAMASPAHAQLGSLQGRVTDESGKPAADAEVTLDYKGGVTYHFTVKTNKKGEWVRAGLYSVGGRWNVSVKKGDLTGEARDIEVPLSAVGVVPDIVLKAAPTVAPSRVTMGPAAGPVDAKSGDSKTKESSELTKLMTEVNVSLAAQDYDVAIAKLTEAITKVPTCATCYYWLGDSYDQKKDTAKAEENYKKAIELDPTSAQAYNGLGIIYWNQSKMVEARTHFEKAVQTDTANKVLESRYYYGLALANDGKMAEAKKSLEDYVRLAPNGPNAATAKELIASIK
ncbi:MAG: tetratricopeptide repeat protein [Vicinamibacterales bacterium]